MRASTARTAYIAVLLTLGLVMAIFGTALPAGGGIAIAGLGCAAVAAGLVLIGLPIPKDDDASASVASEGAESERTGR